MPPRAGPGAGAGPPVPVTDGLRLQQALEESRSPGTVLVVELFTHWAGPCAVARPFLDRLVAQPAPPSVIAVAVDMDRVLEGSRAPLTLALAPQDDDLQPAQWQALLRQHQGTLQPVFLIYACGKLVALVEGPDLPAIGRQVNDAGTDPGLAPVPLGLPKVKAAPYVGVQRRRAVAAFVVQCAWRRRQRREREGEVIDGVKYCGKELARKREQLERAARLQMLAARRKAAALSIQRYWRGFWSRRLVGLLRRGLLSPTARRRLQPGQTKPRPTSTSDSPKPGAGRSNHDRGSPVLPRKRSQVAPAATSAPNRSPAGGTPPRGVSSRSRPEVVKSPASSAASNSSPSEGRSPASPG